jgi:hypothetical protein
MAQAGQVSSQVACPVGCGFRSLWMPGMQMICTSLAANGSSQHSSSSWGSELVARKSDPGSTHLWSACLTASDTGKSRAGRQRHMPAWVAASVTAKTHRMALVPRLLHACVSPIAAPVGAFVPHTCMQAHTPEPMHPRIMRATRGYKRSLMASEVNRALLTWSQQVSRSASITAQVSRSASITAHRVYEHQHLQVQQRCHGHLHRLVHCCDVLRPGSARAQLCAMV